MAIREGVPANREEAYQPLISYSAARQSTLVSMNDRQTIHESRHMHANCGSIIDMRRVRPYGCEVRGNAWNLLLKRSCGRRRPGRRAALARSCTRTARSGAMEFADAGDARMMV